MKQSYFLRSSELFPGSNAVRKYTFKTINLWDSYAHFREKIVLNACHRMI